jgi:hypothetical protein
MVSDEHSRGWGNRDAIGNEQTSSSISAGVLLTYNFSKAWSIESGLVYSRTTTTISPKTIYARPDLRGDVHFEFNCAEGYTYIPPKAGRIPSSGDSIITLGSKSRLNYLSIPVMINYALPFGRFTIHPGLGIAANVLLSGKVDTRMPNSQGFDDHDRYSNEINGLKPLYLNTTGNLEIDYKISPTFSLNLTPSIRMALTSINNEGGIRTYPNYYGVALGGRIRF